MSEMKYANGNPIEIEELSKEEKKQAISEWCEGNPELKKLLEYCDKNGIKTRACCSGHDATLRNKAQMASISMVLEYGNSDKVLKLLAKMEKDMDFEFGIINDTTVPCYVTICSLENKYNEKFFKQINHEFTEIDKGAEVPEDALEKYKDLKGIAEKESDYNGRSVEISQDDTPNIRVGLWDNEDILFIQYISEEEAINYNEKLNEYIVAKEEKRENLPDDPYSTLSTVNQDINEVKKKTRTSRIPISAIKNAFQNIKSGLNRSKNEREEDKSDDR